MIKILITDPISEKGLKLLEEAGIMYDYRPDISHEELMKIIDKYDAVLVRGRTKVTKDVIERGAKLRVIARVGVGLDNIDVETAKARGIKVINAGAATADSVAELTIGLMIALARKIIFGDEALRRGFWAKNFCTGTELHGKTLGIIGVGNIGSRVARIANALGMNVIGYDKFLENAKRMTKMVGANVNFVSMENLLESSDIISIHVPLLPETKHMISWDEVRKMKDGVLLINTARMELFDPEAIIWGLESGKIRGLAADTNLKPENPFVRKLLGFSNVILTPHIGAQTKEAQERAAEVVIKTVIDLLREQ
ncbi:MAG: hydroxyacid dehydrogenase [Candidatus Njordarchaeales archaeon]